MKRLFEDIIIGRLVEPSELVFDEEGSPTFEDLASTGLVSLDQLANGFRTCRAPLLVVNAVNAELWSRGDALGLGNTLTIVSPEVTNPFEYHWENLEVLSLETFRVFSNILADRAPDRVVRLSSVRRGAYFGPGARDVVFYVPPGGIPAVLKLNEPLDNLADGAEDLPRVTEPDSRGPSASLRDKAALTKPGQVGIDGIVWLSGAAAASVPNHGLLFLTQSKCTELTAASKSLTPSAASDLIAKAHAVAPGPFQVPVVVDLFTSRPDSITENRGHGEQHLPEMCVVTTRKNLQNVCGPMLGQRALLFL